VPTGYAEISEFVRLNIGLVWYEYDEIEDQPLRRNGRVWTVHV
jgi:hypothetical protein